MQVLVTLNTPVGSGIGPLFNISAVPGGVVTPNTANLTNLTTTGVWVDVPDGTLQILLTSLNEGVCSTVIPIDVPQAETTTTTCQPLYLVCCSSYIKNDPDKTLQIIQAPLCSDFVPNEVYLDLSNGVGAINYLWVVATLNDIASLGYSGTTIPYNVGLNDLYFVSSGEDSFENTITQCNQSVQENTKCPEDLPEPTTTTTIPPTTTTTTTTPPCKCFEIFGNPGDIVQLIDCAGEYSEIAYVSVPSTIPPFEGVPSMLLCGRTVAIKDNPYFIRDHGSCGELCETVPTTTNSCIRYNVFNTTANSLSYSYVSCNGKIIKQNLASKQCFSFFAQEGSVVFPLGITLGLGECD